MRQTGSRHGNFLESIEWLAQLFGDDVGTPPDPSAPIALAPPPRTLTAEPRPRLYLSPSPRLPFPFNQPPT